MKQGRRVILLLTTLMCLASSFSSFAAEGMYVTKSDGKTEAIFKYCFEDGTFVKNDWMQVSDKWFYFDEEGLSKQNTWAEINGKWYYFDEWSVMLHDTTTPDGYYVGSDGAWVHEETTQ